jgi:hypothetical protein
MKSAPVTPRAANIERRTPNIEHPGEEELTFRFLHFDVGSSKLDVKKTGLRAPGKILSCLMMSHEMLELEIMQLPDAQRAALAAHLLRSLPGVLHEEDDGIAEAMRRDAELDRDPSAGMSLEEFRSALGR